jgi:hypothetical protein
MVGSSNAPAATKHTDPAALRGLPIVAVLTWRLPA